VARPADIPRHLCTFGFAASVSIFGTGGCFLVTNLDRFREGKASDAGGSTSEKDDPTLASTLELTLKGMGVHLNQTIEFRIVDSNNFVQSRGVVEPLDAPATETVTFTVPKGIPAENGPYRLDFYADVNGSHSFDGLKTGLTHDHAWRIEPLVDTPAGKFPHESNLTQIIFNHNTLFVDIREWPKGTIAPPQDTGVDVEVHFPAAKMSEFVGKLCQVRVSEARTAHTVGLYRIPEIPAADFVARIPGIVESGAAYNVDVYVDSNGNGVYDDPSSTGATVDLGWRFPVTASTPAVSADAGAATEFVGIHLEFDPHGPPPGVTDVGAP
jgi:hypothetical protein